MTAAFIFAFAIFIPAPIVREIEPPFLCLHPSQLWDESPLFAPQTRCSICDQCEMLRRQSSVVRFLPFGIPKQCDCPITRLPHRDDRYRVLIDVFCPYHSTRTRFRRPL